MDRRQAPARMIRRAMLLAWRLHRAELVAVSVASMAITLVWIRAAADLDLVRRQCEVIGPDVAPCGGLAETGMFYTDVSQNVVPMVGGLAAMLPFAAGVVLGVPLASRELEHRTAHLAWPMARSRGRWLALRLLPVLVLGVLILAPAAMAGEVLTRSFYPLTDPAANFEHYGIRGPIQLLRFVPALFLGALVGLVVGRQLPALLVAGLLVAGLGAGLGVLRPFGAPPVEQPPRTMEGPFHVGRMYVGVIYRDAAGNIMAEEDAWALMAGSEGDEDLTRLPRETFLVIPGERMPEVMAREAGAIGAASLGVGGLLIAAARRRRPA